jgi:hypothetical protein
MNWTGPPGSKGPVMPLFAGWSFFVPSLYAAIGTILKSNNVSNSKKEHGFV